jgi:hypothetical protein
MPSTLSQTRLRWIQINHQEVLFLDFSQCEPAESLLLIDSFRQAMQDRPPGSVMMLTDLTKAIYDPSIATHWKAARVEHAAKIRASALYGLSGLVGMAVRGMIDTARLMGLPMGDKQLRIFKTEAEAAAWLVQQ